MASPSLDPRSFWTRYLQYVASVYYDEDKRLCFCYFVELMCEDRVYIMSDVVVHTRGDQAANVAGTLHGTGPFDVVVVCCL